jgi:hypothetical protein
MKKLMMALAVIAFAGTGAMAQAKKCGTNDGHVCKTYGGQSSCYKTDYAQNYKICKGAAGYYVCCGNGVQPNAYDAPYTVHEEALPVYTTYTSRYEDEETDHAADHKCGHTEKHVCKTVGDKTYCYKTEHAQNYKVCKGHNGYHVCCH